MSSNLAKEIVGVIKSSNANETSAYDTPAQVVRIDDDGTAWVHIPGGVDETPVKMTVSASAGDTVQVRVSGGRAWITGNASAPPTDDSTAIQADTKATEAEGKATIAVDAAEAAQVLAEEAAKEARAVNQYFWHTESGGDAGAHVTEIPQEEFVNTPSGGNSRLTSDGMEVRDGLDVLAKFGATQQIGKDDETHIVEDYHSLQMIDANKQTYFHVSDLRDEHGNLEVTETLSGDGDTRRFYLMLAINVVRRLTINGVEQTSGYSTSGKYLTFETAPVNGDIIVIEYLTTDLDAKAYTLGIRSLDSYIGPLSFAEGSRNIASNYAAHAEGSNNTASGRASHAEGTNNKATGYYSHAEGGGNTASGSQSHAEGKSNTASGDYSHAEGRSSTATGDCAHAEGMYTTAGSFSHAEGYQTSAINTASHAEGWMSEAKGAYTHAQNYRTRATYNNQTVLGKYNADVYGNAVEIGNGTNFDMRSNALAVTWDGDSLIALDTNAATGTTDGDLYAAIKSLGWNSSVIV